MIRKDMATLQWPDGAEQSFAQSGLPSTTIQKLHTAVKWQHYNDKIIVCNNINTEVSVKKINFENDPRLHTYKN